jgi:hypothetical protein
MAMRWYQHRVHGGKPAPSDSHRLPAVDTAATARARGRATGGDQGDGLVTQASDRRHPPTEPEDHGDDNADLGHEGQQGEKERDRVRAHDL